ncbi:hypothetical protein [Actinacidiphila glaucinigra]
MTWRWIFLAAFSLTLLPAGLALTFGRVPAGLRPRLTPVRRRGWGFLALYALAPLNVVPRLMGAPPAVILVATATGGAMAIAGLTLVAAATRRLRIAAL